MAVLLSILPLIVAASAAPVVIPVSQSAVVATRQLEELDYTSMIENEFSSLLNECKDVVFVWARGTAEAGNMGPIAGQPLGDVLRREYGHDLAIEGTDYAALFSTNLLPGGTDMLAAGEMHDILEDINRRCPASVIVCGGYSRQEQIAGVVTFGDTQARVDNQQIPNFPKDKLKIFCGGDIRDAVCDGILAAAVLVPHLSYARDAEEAGRFLIDKINAVRK